MELGINYVILANHLVSLITSSTTNSLCPFSSCVHFDKMTKNLIWLPRKTSRVLMIPDAISLYLLPGFHSAYITEVTRHDS
jgi:hypothetical protein